MVAGGDLAELVAGGLGGLVVVGGGLLGGGVAGEGAELEQRPWGGGAVQVPVGDDRPAVSAFGSAVVGGQVLDELCSGGAQRRGPVPGDPVGVSGVGPDVAQGDAAC